MYLRITKQRNVRGEPVEYAAIAESYRVHGQPPKTNVLLNFGKVTPKIRAQLEGLRDSISTYLEKDEE